LRNNNSKPNVFVVDTPFQLLNAIEAAKHFALSNSHLVIIKYPGLNQAAFDPLIKKNEWAEVMFLEMEKEEYRVCPFSSNVVVRKWYNWLLHFRRRNKFTKICRSFGPANRLFLGHYWVPIKYYMRHFANNLKFEKLFLLDDGTDIININLQRKLAGNSTGKSGEAMKIPTGFSVRNIMTYLKKKYWDWNLGDAESLTFFTTYELGVRTGDQVIKNEYRYLRSVAVNSSASEEVCFLGQCFAEDEYMSKESYLEHLKAVKEHFKGDKIIYVAHPRQSEQLLRTITVSLGWEVRRFGIPIEVAMVAGGYFPKVLASFNCSALESCSNIFDTRLKIACFRISPAHLLRWSLETAAIYEHFESKVGPSFEIIQIKIGDPQLTPYA